MHEDCDGTVAIKPRPVPLKRWGPNVRDRKVGVPTWGSLKGKGLVGAINDSSSKACNAFSFVTLNADGDGDMVWPFVQRDEPVGNPEHGNHVYWFAKGGRFT